MLTFYSHMFRVQTDSFCPHGTCYFKILLMVFKVQKSKRMPRVFFFIQATAELFNFSYLHFLDLQIMSCVNKL